MPDINEHTSSNLCKDLDRISGEEVEGTSNRKPWSRLDAATWSPLISIMPHWDQGDRDLHIRLG